MTTLKAFVQNHGATTISTNILHNTNGYPFIFVDDQTLYFSKAGALKVAQGDALKPIAGDLFVVETKNEAGEVRMKLTFNSGNTSSVEDMF